jgi:hypothetical protein
MAIQVRRYQQTRVGSDARLQGKTGASVQLSASGTGLIADYQYDDAFVTAADVDAEMLDAGYTFLTFNPADTPDAASTALHKNVDGEFAGLTPAVIAAADLLVFEDADASNAKRVGTVQELIDLVTSTDQIALNSKTGLTDVAAGMITINGGDNTKFDIKDSEAVMTDYSDPQNPIKYVMSWTGLIANDVANIATESFTAIHIENIGTPAVPIPSVVVTNTRPTGPERRNKVTIGFAVHSSGTQIDSVDSAPVFSYGVGAALDDLWISLGDRSVYGNHYTPNAGGNLLMDKSAGVVSGRNVNASTNPLDPNLKVVGLEVGITNYTYSRRDGSGGYIVTNLATVDPGNYDDDTPGLTVMPNGKYQIQRIILDPRRTESTILEYGQKPYNTLALAIDGIAENNVIKNPDLRGLVLAGWLVVQDGATDLTVTTDAVIRDNTSENSQGSGFGIDPTAIHTDVGGEIVTITQTAVAPDDRIVFEDDDDSNNKKSDTVQGILDLVTVPHSATTGQTADDHHNQVHSIIGADHNGFPGGDLLFLREDGTFSTPPSGGGGASFEWRYSNSVAASDPGANTFRMNNLTHGAVTQLYYNDVAVGGLDIGPLLFSKLIPGDQIYIQKSDDSTKAAAYEVSAQGVDNVGWWTIPVTFLGETGNTFDNNKNCLHGFTTEGNHIKNNTDTVDPTVNDDANDGYEIGSLWLNTNTNEWFVCSDATAGAAIWSSLTAVGGDVVGPGPTVGDENVTVFDGTGGLTIKDGGMPLLAGSSASQAWEYDDNTAEAQPGLGLFRMNSTTKTAVTELYVDNQAFSGSNRSVIMSSLKSGDYIDISVPNDPTAYLRVTVDGTPSLETGYFKIPVAFNGTGGPASFTDGQLHGIGGFMLGSSSSFSPQQAESSTPFTINSVGTPGLVPNLAVTPGAGTYTMTAWIDVDILGGSDDFNLMFFNGNIEVPITRGETKIDDVFGGRLCAMITASNVVVAGGASVDVRYLTNDTTGITVRNRRLVLIQES